MEKRNIEKLDINEIVRENLILGVPRENIKQTLLAQGYADFEIDRAIKKALMDKYVVEVHEKSAKKRFVFRSLTKYMFFIFLFLLFMAVILLFIMYGEKLFVFDGSSNSSLGILDCGSTNSPTNDCFYEATLNCKLARVIVDTPIYLQEFGFMLNSRSNQEIQGIEEEKCLFYYQQSALFGRFTNQERQNLLGLGQTTEQINLMELSYNQNFSSLIGKDMVCKFENSKFIRIVERWKDGKMALSDLSHEECQGSTIPINLLFSNLQTISLPIKDEKF